MTKAQFIASVEAKPNFIKWGIVPTIAETLGELQKWHGIAHITTDDGTNLFNVWFIWDSATDSATWQQADALTPSANLQNTKMDALTAYLKANFIGYHLNWVDTQNNWAEADVYVVSGSDLAKTTVLVYKQGNNPITHKKVV